MDNIFERTEMKLIKYLTLLSRILLGGILLFSRIIKLPSIDTLIWEIEQYQILPTSLAIAYGNILPPLEIVLGILLISGIYLRYSALVSTLLVLSFTISKVSALVRGLNIDVCPCFGPAVPLLLVNSLAIDFVMLVLEIPLLIYRNEFFSVRSWLSAKRNH